MAQVLGSVVHCELVNAEAMVNARVEGTVAPPGDAIVEFRQSDEDDGEQRSSVPLIVEKDVKVVQGVLVEEVRLIEEEDGVNALASEVRDVL